MSYSEFVKKVKEFDPLTHWIVFGYSRTIEKLLCNNYNNSYFNIPEIIVCIILQYCYIGPFWKYPCNGSIQSIDKQNKSILTTNYVNPLSISYANILMQSTSNKIYNWRIQIRNNKMNYSLKIGICSINPSICYMVQISDTFRIKASDKDYWLDAVKYGHEYWKPYGRVQCGYTLPYRTKQISTNLYGTQFELGVRVNLKYRQISFSVNGMEQGIAYRNINMNEYTVYRLGVTLLNTHSSVTINDLTITYQ